MQKGSRKTSNKTKFICKEKKLKPIVRGVVETLYHTIALRMIRVHHNNNNNNLQEYA